MPRGLAAFPILLLTLALVGGPWRAATASGQRPQGANPWSVLLEDGATEPAAPREESKMNVASIILALAATGVALIALLWCRQITRRMAQLGAAVLTEREKLVVEQATNRVETFEARLDELSQTVNTEVCSLGRTLDVRMKSLESAVARLEQQSEQLESRLERIDGDTRKLDSRTAETEETCRRIGPIAQNLARLEQFKGQVEQIHSRVLQAFNGSLTQDAGSDKSAPQDRPHEAA
jgi:hypothetical protein